MAFPAAQHRGVVLGAAEGPDAPHSCEGSEAHPVLKAGEIPSQVDLAADVLLPLRIFPETIVVDQAQRQRDDQR